MPTGVVEDEKKKGVAVVQEAVGDSDPIKNDEEELQPPPMEESIRLGPKGDHYWAGDILVHESYGFCELLGWR